MYLLKAATYGSKVAPPPNVWYLSYCNLEETTLFLSQFSKNLIVHFWISSSLLSCSGSFRFWMGSLSLYAMCVATPETINAKTYRGA